MRIEGKSHGKLLRYASPPSPKVMSALARDMWLPFLPLPLTNAPADMPELSPEELQRRIEQREKDITRTKRRQSYRAYVERVPKDQRNPSTPNVHPTTPDPRPREVSRRRWQILVNAWKKRLYEMYQEHEGTEPSDQHAFSEDPEMLHRDGDGYDSDEMAEDMATLAMDRPETPLPPMSYADLVRRDASASDKAPCPDRNCPPGDNPRPPCDCPEPEPEPEPKKKKAWADYSSDEESEPEAPSLPPLPAERQTWANVVKPPGPKPSWSNVVKTNK